MRLLLFATTVKPEAKKPEAKKPEPKPVAKKVEKAVEKAKTKQPPKPISKGGLRDRISSAVKKGVERHKAAVKKVSSSPAAKGLI